MKTEEYARWFRASTPYISAHRDRTFVIALNGEALMHGNLANIVHDLALLHVLGARLVVVHGARPQLDAALPDSAFHTHGGTTRRITDREAMGRVAGVCGQLRAELEALFSTGLPTSPLHNTEIQLIAGNFVIAKPIGVLGGVDHELTGQPRRIRANGIDRALGTGAIVLLSPIGYSPSGQAFNLAADELAERVAIALQADKLIAFDQLPYLQSADGKRLANLSPTQLQAALELDASEDVPGSAPVDIRCQQDSPASSSREPELLAIAPIGENTRRNLRALVGAVRGGVASGQMVSYADDGALLAELFTAEGVGTQITEEDRRLVRRAESRDVADIVELIRPLEESGMLVKRSRDRLEREVDRFFVAEIDGIVVGCCALFPAGTGAELACVAVHPAHRGGDPGLGQKLLATAEDAARSRGLDHLFVLTTQAQDWFIENGFQQTASDALPAPNRALYNVKRNAKVLIKTLETPWAAPDKDRKHG